MINKLIASIIFVSALFALSLSVLGVQAPIEIGAEFRAFISSCSLELSKYKISIPSIPSIPELETINNGFLQVVDYLRQFLNGFINILNFITMLLNYIIQGLEMLFIILKNIFILRDKFISA